MLENIGLPDNIPYERSILGACISWPELMGSTRFVIDSSEFSLRAHQETWSRMCQMYDSGIPVDVATLYTELNKHNEAAGHSLPSQLFELTEGVPELPNLDTYVAGVKEKATLRRIIHSAKSTVDRCVLGIEKSQDILDSMGSASVDIAPRAKGTGAETAGEIIERVGLSALLQPRKKTGLRFPWGWMTNNTGGMGPAELWVLAGHTSTGKTTAAMQHAIQAARRGKSVMVFSLEVGKESLLTKSIYHMAGVNCERAKAGKLGPKESEMVRDAAAEIAEMPLIMDTQSTTVAAIHSSVRRQRQKQKIDHVIVDYLQLLGNTGRQDSRAQAVGANAWALKMLAVEFGIPVLLLSQFSRQSNKPGQERPPDLTDLKESGDIENHANGVWFIHRKTKENVDMVPVTFMLPKQREGRRDIEAEFVFNVKMQRFQQVAEEEEDR